MKDNALNQLSRSLAAELSAADFPHLWRVQRNSRRAWYETLTTSDAWLMLQRDGQRIIISADHPREMKRGGISERITVASDRTPEAIARDIRARLLPAAREYFRKCHEQTRKEKQRQITHALLLHRLQSFTRWQQTDSDGTRSSWCSKRTRADVYSDHISEMKIDSPSIEEAIQILTILERGI
jgi:hypothetical protein